MIKQVTNDKDFISLKDMYDPKILFYKYLVNKHTKNPVKCNDVFIEKNRRNFNKTIIKTCLRNHMKEEEKRLNKPQKLMTQRELDKAIETFEIKFLNGEYVSEPHLYINI